ncbi:MAG TPA: polysaccharide deacetylase family protein, partial [Desulfobacteria bacterium]|nr:polysaccharide deacetylase family protein [Desulfobacteria bacterium]
MYDREDRVITRSDELTNRREKCVVLTFDDGPGRYLPQILDVLKMENVPALFFWQTRLLHPKRPWRRVLEEGHMIGSHTCKHPDLCKMDYRQQYDEIFRSKQRLENTIGQPILYFRPPFGQYNTWTIKALEDLDLTPVMWSVASMDWELKANPERIVSNVVLNLEEGAIVLLHELPQTLLVLRELIRQIRNQGYSFSLLPTF